MKGPYRSTKSTTTTTTTTTTTSTTTKSRNDHEEEEDNFVAEVSRSLKKLSLEASSGSEGVAIEGESSASSYDVGDLLFKPSTEQRELVLRALQTPDDKRAISTLIPSKSLNTLQKGRELDDEVINGFLALLEVASKAREIQKCYFFSTFFYALLCSGKSRYDYQRIRRWTKNVNLLEYERVFVPVHLPGHWCLAVIHIRERKFEYYDSLHGSPSSCFQQLKRYLADEVKDKSLLRKREITRTFLEENQISGGGDDGDDDVVAAERREREYVDSISRWREEVPRDFPRQRAGSSDCGVYLCALTAMLSSTPLNSIDKFHFKPSDMDDIRLSIAWRFLKQ